MSTQHSTSQLASSKPAPGKPAQEVRQPGLSLVDWSLLLTLSLLWGASFLFQKVAVAELPPFTIVFIRVALAAAVLTIIMRAMGLRFPSWGLIAALFGMAFLNNVIPFSLLVYGQTEIGAGLASILNATTPLFTVIVAQMLTSDEKLTWGKLIGVLLGILGVACLVGLDALAGLGAQVYAQIACLGAAVSYAFSVVYARRFRDVSPVVTATGQLTCASILMLPLMLFVDQPWTLSTPSMPVIWSMVALAIPSTALAYLLYFRILKSAGATNLALVTFLVPISAVILGALVLGERLGITDAIGMALIGLGLAAINSKRKRLAARPGHVMPTEV